MNITVISLVVVAVIIFAAVIFKFSSNNEKISSVEGMSANSAENCEGGVCSIKKKQM